MIKVVDKRPSTRELFALDDANSVPKWLQLKNRFIYLITSGYYLPGDQLPTVRGLAAEIEINYNTVSKVYRSLEEDGYIQSKTRQGAFVCDVSGKAGVSLAATAEMLTREYLNKCLELGLSIEDVEEQFRQRVAEEKERRAAGKAGQSNEGSEKDASESGAGRIVVFSADANADGRSARGANGA